MSKSGSTMTTPTPMLEAGEPGLPDIAWLTRLANEMFRSQPGSPWPSDPTPTTPLGGFGATTPSAPMPPGSVAEVPQPTAAAVSVPTPGTAIPGETELRGPLGASPPIAASGFGLTSSSSPLPSVPTPTTPLGGFGATTPSAPMPPGSVAEVPQPTPAAVRVPTPGTAIPGETELRGPLGASPPIAAGGFGLTSSSSPLPSVPTPTTPLGGFGATTPSTPMPPGSAAEVPQPTAAAVSVPPLGMAIPGETELRGLLGSWPPNAAGGLGLTPSSSPLPSVPTPTTPLGGFGATTPSAPMPPGSAAEVPQPTAAAVSMPTPGTAIPGETELRGLLGASPPIAVGGFGWTSPFDPTPLPDLARLDMFNPGEDALRALLGGIPASPAPAAAQPPDTPGATAPSFYYFLEELGQGVPTTTAASPAAPASPAYDVDARRADFPILSERFNGRPLIWLDNGATTQKPRSVIDRLVYFYEHENSNVRRAAHELAARATDAYEGARETVRRFVHAGSADEIVFVRGTTEAINLVAQSWGRQYIGAGDEIVITWLEHHANIVPWQMLCAQTGAKLRVAPVDDDGQVILEEYGRLLGPRTKLVAFTQVSNALGIITPSAVMTAMAHAVGARVLLDG